MSDAATTERKIRETWVLNVTRARELVRSSVPEIEKALESARKAISTELGRVASVRNTAVERLETAVGAARKDGAKRVRDLNVRAQGIRRDLGARVVQLRARSYASLGIATTKQVEALARKVNKLAKNGSQRRDG